MGAIDEDSKLERKGKEQNNLGDARHAQIPFGWTAAGALSDWLQPVSPSAVSRESPVRAWVLQYREVMDAVNCIFAVN